MVIGNGLIASSFKNFKSDRFLFFASGVSNSSESDNLKFNREKNLLIESLSENKNKVIVYFSSISILTIESEYTKHKKEMEEIIKQSDNEYYIFRLPQVLGNGGNQNNLINFIKNKILSNEDIQVWKGSERSIMDIDDIYKIVTTIISTNGSRKTYNISGVEYIPIEDIISMIGSIISVSPKTNITNKTSTIYKTNSDEVEKCIKSMEIITDGYTNKILKKYVRY